MKIKLTILLILTNFVVYSQIKLERKDKEAYVSYFSKDLKIPVYTKHNLFNGGGECSRKKYKFRGDKYTAKDSDYYKTGYDKGHLVPAEDMAFNCKYDSLTFSYYNAFPQHPNLNRKQWLKIENEVRKLSINKHIVVYTGGYGWKNTIGNNVFVPAYCFKVVKQLGDDKVIYCVECTNEPNPKCKEIKFEDLKNKLNFELK